MTAARDLKKGMVITLDGAHWIVEDYHSQKAAQRHPVLHVKLRNMKTRHVAERSFDEADQVQDLLFAHDILLVRASTRA